MTEIGSLRLLDFVFSFVTKCHSSVILSFRENTFASYNMYRWSLKQSQTYLPSLHVSVVTAFCLCRGSIVILCSGVCNDTMD